MKSPPPSSAMHSLNTTDYGRTTLFLAFHPLDTLLTNFASSQTLAIFDLVDGYFVSQTTSLAQSTFHRGHTVTVLAR